MSALRDGKGRGRGRAGGEEQLSALGRAGGAGARRWGHRPEPVRGWRGGTERRGHSSPQAEPPFAAPPRSWGPGTGRPLCAVGPRVGGSGSTPGRNVGWEGPQLRHGHLRHSHRSATAQHGREAPDPALRQGEDPHGAGGRGCRCLRVPGSPALPSASDRCHGRPGGCIGARRLSSAFARRRARTGRAWGTAPSASGSSWCCCSKERPSPSPPWTRRGERCSATRCRPWGRGVGQPCSAHRPGGCREVSPRGEGAEDTCCTPWLPTVALREGGGRFLGGSATGTPGAGAAPGERLILLPGTGPDALQRASAASSLLQGTRCAEGLCARRSAARSALQRRLQDRYGHHRGLPGGQAGPPRVSGWHCPKKG